MRIPAALGMRIIPGMLRTPRKDLNKPLRGYRPCRALIAGLDLAGIDLATNP